MQVQTQAQKVVKSSRIKNIAAKLFANKLAVLGLVVVVIIILLCVFAPLLTPYNPAKPDFSAQAQAPNPAHPFGTDKLGRDILARVLYGGRVSILIGLSGAVGGMLLGVFIGSLCGYFRGTLDAIFVKIAELVSIFPQILLVLVLVTILQQSMMNLVYIFVATGWVATFRMVRGRFLSLREESFVEACRVFGLSDLSIAFKHILPNCLGPVIVQLTLNTAGFILQEAALSYIGLGVPSGTPTWGNIMNAAKEIISISQYPWVWLAPGIAIALFVLGVNFFGDGLRDALDPKQI
jgi:peptide/nickel transport system permease protein